MGPPCEWISSYNFQHTKFKLKSSYNFNCRRTMRVFSPFGSSAAGPIVGFVHFHRPTIAARDIFMPSCETSNSSIWGCYPSPTFHSPSLISYRPLTSCKKWMRHQISFSRLAFLLLLRPTRDPIRSLCQLRHHINMPHNPSRRIVRG